MTRQSPRGNVPGRSGGENPGFALSVFLSLSKKGYHNRSWGLAMMNGQDGLVGPGEKIQLSSGQVRLDSRIPFQLQVLSPAWHKYEQEQGLRLSPRNRAQLAEMSEIVESSAQAQLSGSTLYREAKDGRSVLTVKQ